MPWRPSQKQRKLPGVFRHSSAHTPVSHSSTSDARRSGLKPQEWRRDDSYRKSECSCQWTQAFKQKKSHFQQENKPDATRNKWGSLKWTGCYLPALYKTIKGHEKASDVFSSEELYWRKNQKHSVSSVGQNRALSDVWVWFESVNSYQSLYQHS